MTKTALTRQEAVSQGRKRASFVPKRHPRNFGVLELVGAVIRYEQAERRRATSKGVR